MMALLVTQGACQVSYSSKPVTRNKSRTPPASVDVLHWCHLCAIFVQLKLILYL